MISNSNINFSIDRSKLEGVQDMNNNIFPSNFLCLICGRPGSGKTSLLKFILKSPELLFKKYDYVFICTPSPNEYKSLLLPSLNLNDKLDFTWIDSRIKGINITHPNEYINVLFILDDLVAKLHKDGKSEDILSFIFNRRHKLNNVLNF